METIPAIKLTSIKLTKFDHDVALKYATDQRATAEERDILKECALAYASNEPVSKSHYNALQALTGGSLSPLTPIMDR